MKLVERQQALAALRQARAEAVQGVVSAAVVDGEAGCGKTWLMRAAAEEAAADGVAILVVGGAGGARLSTQGQWRELEHIPRSSLDAERALDGRPLMICLDDAHQASEAQLRYVLEASHAFQSYGVVVVTTLAPEYGRHAADFQNELMRQAAFRRVGVRRLSRSAVRQLAAQHGEAATADELYALSGGNPLLLRALVQEGPLGRAGAEGHPRGPFAQAVLSCLRRGGQRLADAAVALAVLGADATPELLAALMEISPEAAVESVERLIETGIADGCRFRSAGAAGAVLDAEPLARRGDLHSRAAVLLHAAAADPVTVARHLVIAKRADEPWAITALQEAAHRALTDDDPDDALRYLELVARECKDEALRSAARVSIAIITCRHNPSLAEQFLFEAIEADWASLARPQAGELLSRILLDGWSADVRSDASAAIRPRRTALGSVQSQVREWWTSLLIVHHELLGLGRSPEGKPAAPPARKAGGGRGARTRSGRSALHPAQSAAATVWVSSTQAGTAMLAAEARGGVRGTPLTDTTLPVIVNHLKVLAFADHPNVAMELGRRLAQEAADRGTPGWEAVFFGALSDIAVRSGAFVQAIEYGQRAMTRVSVHRDTMFSVGPRLSMLHANTARGQYTEAGLLLAEVMPEQLFASVEVLAYLRAHGRYLLATQDPRGALRQFARAGELAAEWDIDRPALMPWRLDAAEALLALGDVESADRLLREQWAVRDTSSHRVRGMTLRLHSATRPARHRIDLLRTAVEELQQSKDRYELARALADLSAAYRQAGQTVNAGIARRRAWRQAKECGALPLCEAILPGVDLTDDGDERHDAGPEALERLSTSERRVATLASQGFANREIAGRLHITVSTVEQHLTRIYRKLDINGREGLRRNAFEVEDAGRPS